MECIYLLPTTFCTVNAMLYLWATGTQVYRPKINIHLFIYYIASNRIIILIIGCEVDWLVRRSPKPPHPALISAVIYLRFSVNSTHYQSLNLVYQSNAFILYLIFDRYLHVYISGDHCPVALFAFMSTSLHSRFQGFFICHIISYTGYN